MALPFQCLAAAGGSDNEDSGWSIVAASGSQLVLQSSSGASSTWSASTTTPSAGTNEDAEEGPPGKKLKLTPSSPSGPNFSCLVVSHSKTYFAAVTAEDKCIRVFKIGQNGSLEQLSERCMPRRPCSLAITSDDATILCADKFGDVYSVPLIMDAEDEPAAPAAQESVESDEKKFVPAASVLTVHSGRNRKVLEEQMKQASLGQSKKKEVVSFKHDLLLGHVSMLTDIVTARVDDRSYIITADRDEHIRVSRGIPQAHIIEGFCHGHESFINSLCLVSHDLLVSGGGDDDLYVWEWAQYRLRNKIGIREAVLRYLRADPQLASGLPANETEFKVAVSGIWKVPGAESDSVVVACEGVAALFAFSVDPTSDKQETIPLHGNALGVVFVSNKDGCCTAVVSVDNMHMPGSTAEIRKDKVPSRLQCFALSEDGHWAKEAAMEGVVGHLDGQMAESHEASSEESLKAFRDIAYGVGNLRKRPGAED